MTAAYTVTGPLAAKYISFNKKKINVAPLMII